jgi:peptide chain release factor subunit 1
MVDSPIALRNTLRRLADWPVAEPGVVSAYLDLRPHATQDPNVRSGLIVLRDGLGAIGRADEAPEREYLESIASRLDAEIERRLPDVYGLALFAGDEDRFEVAETRLMLNDAVSFGPHPRLVALARLADAEQAVLALADTNTLRLFVHRSGTLEEMGLVDDDTDDYRKTSAGGWSQARFQRHVEAHREAFAKLAAEAVEAVVDLEDVKVLLLAGDEVAVPLLEAELSQRLREMVRGTLRIEMRASLSDIEAEALPALEGLRIDDANDAAERLVGAAQADAMGVSGHRGSHAALQIGQAMELIVDANNDDDRLDELVRLAAATDARIRFADHEGLRSLGGVGALLRFRLDRAQDEPVGAGRASE